MSTPIQAGSTDQRLRCVAVQDDYSTFKTDLVIADIQSLVVKRSGAADVTVTENALDTDPDDAHTDGNIYNAGGGEYLVSVPDAAVATGAPSVKIYGTWTDGADSGYLIGDEYPLVGYNWQTGLNVTVAPLSASITARVNGTTINYFVGEVVAQTVAITDSAGSAVDLSAKTLQVVIDSPKASHGDVQVIASGSITVSGASNNQISFTNSAAVTATARTLRWALRDTANGDEVLAHGRVVVTEAAEED